MCLYVGLCINAYYMTQSDLFGTLLHSYGIAWWIGTLAAVKFVHVILTRALPSPRATEASS